MTISTDLAISNSMSSFVPKYWLNWQTLVASMNFIDKGGTTKVYSLSPGFWQSFVTIGVHKDHIPALARFCKKQLTGFFVRLLFFVKCKHYH